MAETQNQPNNEESVVIIGTRRDDVLYGSLGHNIFYGGLGNDTFIVNNRNDQIVERYGEGTDTVYTHTTYTLPNYVENLTMTGHDNIFWFRQQFRQRPHRQQRQQPFECRPWQGCALRRGG